MSKNNNNSMKKSPRGNPKRESILNAAIMTFPILGYESTSMDTIAEAAGASKTTIYQYFPSKEILFEAVIEKYLKERESVKSVPLNENLTLRESLKAIIDIELSFVQNPKWLGISQVFIAVFIQNSNMALKTKLGYEYGEMKHLIDFLKNAVQKGELKIKNIPLTAGIFYSMIQGVLVFPYLMGTPLDDKILIPMQDEVIELFLSRYKN